MSDEFEEEIDLCQECIYYNKAEHQCTVPEVIEDDRYDPDLMVDECIHHESE